MKRFVYLLILLLVVLHQDFWWWHTHTPLVFGFIPIGLAWHAGISLAAALVGGLAVRYCWPSDVDLPAGVAPPESPPSPSERG